MSPWMILIALQSSVVSASDIEAGLLDGDAAQVVRMCDAVVAHGLEDLAPELCQCVRSPAGLDSRERAAVQMAALDALIRMKAEVPPPLVRELVDTYPAQAMILAMRHPREFREVFLNELRKSEETWQSTLWWTAANVLAADVDPALASTVLAGLRVELEVFVLRAVGGAGGGFGGRYGRRGSGRPPPPPFPVFATYQLLDHANAQHIAGGSKPELLIGGCVDIYFRRVPARLHSVPDAFVRTEFSSLDHCRLEIVRYLAYAPDETFPLEESTSRFVHWVDEYDYVSKVRGWVAEFEAKRREMLSRLVALGLLDADESRTLGPFLEVRIIDDDAVGQPPLPDWRGAPR